MTTALDPILAGVARCSSEPAAAARQVAVVAEVAHVLVKTRLPLFHDILFVLFGGTVQVRATAPPPRVRLCAHGRRRAMSLNGFAPRVLGLFAT